MAVDSLSPPALAPPPPSNLFSISAKRLNRSKGTATLIVSVPGPGQLVLSGKGIKKQRKNASAAGKVNVKVISTGKKKRELEGTGAVKVKAKITFTPTGGSPNSKTTKIRLIKPEK